MVPREVLCGRAHLRSARGSGQSGSAACFTFARTKEAIQMSHDNAISVLNNLIETCKDGEKGFKAAAEGLTAPDIKLRFLNYSRERAQMTSELQAEVRRLGGDPEQSGSMAGALHRGWLDIKSVATGKDDYAIVAEAERGEDVAKNAYESALN